MDNFSFFLHLDLDRQSLVAGRRFLISIVFAIAAVLTLLPGPAAAQAGGVTPILLWRHQYDFNYLWLMNVNKATPVGLPNVAGGNWVVGGMGDLDGNGTRDIIWYEKTTGAVYAWYMNGTNVENVVGLGGVEPDGVGSGWTLEAVADLNGDGIPDILWRHSVIGAIYVWYFQPDGSHTVVGYGFMKPSEYRMAGVGHFKADFTGENLTGIVWSLEGPTAGASTGSTLIWGIIESSQDVNYFVYGEPNNGMLIQQVADFDGDGISDFLWTDASIGANTIWYLKQSGGYSYGQAVPYTPLGYLPAATVDFNGDGMADIAWFSPMSGYAMQWLMTGRGNIPVSNSLGNVGTTWFLPPQ